MPGRTENDAVMRLNELSIGSTATIREVGGSGALRQHFLDMGLIQGTEVTVIKYAPMGDPIELRIHGYELTIRLEDAKSIEISEPHRPKHEETKEHAQKQEKNGRLEKHHPGYGEGENSMTARKKIRCRIARLSPLRWLETRIAERRRCLIS